MVQYVSHQTDSFLFMQVTWVDVCSCAIQVFAGLVTEFKAYSKPVAQYLELLRNDQLYESVSVEPFAKSLRYFQVGRPQIYEPIFSVCR